MKVGDTYMYLPEEVILRVNKIEGDTVFMGPKYRCLRSYGAARRATRFKKVRQ